MGSGHSSGPAVSRRLKRPTREPRGGPPLDISPIWSCSTWGLPCRPCYQERGALLPHHFTLTGPASLRDLGGVFSVALSFPSPGPGVTRHATLRSSDFPPRGLPRSDRLFFFGRISILTGVGPPVKTSFLTHGIRPPLQPVLLRCFSFECKRHSTSSRLAGRALRRPRHSRHFRLRPLAAAAQEVPENHPGHFGVVVQTA